jgi:sirohydrochlorin cobaltochelatase
VTAPPAARAVILFAHGAADARWSVTLGELQARMQARLPGAHVGLAFLEFQRPTLAAAVASAVAAGARAIDVAPVFWASGGHIASDLPPMLADLRARHPSLELRVLPVLSELPGMLDFIADAVTRDIR